MQLNRGFVLKIDKLKNVKEAIDEEEKKKEVFCVLNSIEFTI